MEGNKKIFGMQMAHLFSRKEFKIAWVISFGIISIAFIEVCLSVRGSDQSIIFSASSGWIGNLNVLDTQVMKVFYLYCISLVAAFPFSDSYLEDQRGHSLISILSRCSWKVYWHTGAVLSFLSGFLVICLPLLVSQLLSFVLFPVSGGVMEGYSIGAWYDTSHYEIGYLFPSLRINHPYLNNLMFIFYSSLFAALNAVLSYLFSLLGVNKKLLVLGLPTLLWLLYDTVIVFIYPGLSFSYYLYPNDSLIKRPWFFVVLPIAMIMINLILCLIVKLRKSEAALL